MSKTTILNDKPIAYHEDTQFQVQIGRYTKGSYKTKYTVTGDLVQAVRYYNAINIGNGYKKRLVAWSLNKPVLAKQAS